MEKALFLEGEPGVGKTDVARVLSEILDTPLIRLQCYEGLDLTQAVYEWDYPRQLLAIQMRSGNGGSGTTATEAAADLFSEDYLLRRPLLQAIDRSREKAPVLLIDELDRADEEFEAFLFELLGEFQITIPQLGTYRALIDRSRSSPRTARARSTTPSSAAASTSGSTTRRRTASWRSCGARCPRRPRLRPARSFRSSSGCAGNLYKRPGVSESLDWARGLTHLGADRLDGALVDRTLGFLLKYQDDVEAVRGPRAEALLQEAAAE